MLHRWKKSSYLNGNQMDPGCKRMNNAMTIQNFNDDTFLHVLNCLKWMRDD